MGFVITEDYDSEAMAADIENIAADLWNVEVAGEVEEHGHGHGFSVVAPSGRTFLVTVTAVYQPPTEAATGVRPGHPGDINDPERWP